MLATSMEIPQKAFLKFGSTWGDSGLLRPNPFIGKKQVQGQRWLVRRFTFEIDVAE